jgi:hypothetical protein
MKDTDGTPPRAPRRREQWRFRGRRPLNGWPELGDFYLWVREHPSDPERPMHYGMPVEMFWTQR